MDWVHIQYLSITTCKTLQFHYPPIPQHIWTYHLSHCTTSPFTFLDTVESSDPALQLLSECKLLGRQFQRRRLGLGFSWLIILRIYWIDYFVELMILTSALSGGRHFWKDWAQLGASDSTTPYKRRCHTWCSPSRLPSSRTERRTLSSCVAIYAANKVLEKCI